MKRIILIVFIIFAIGLANAQEPMFVKDDKVVNLGIGIGGYGIASGIGVASLDYCIADGIIDEGSIGVGPYVGFGIYNRYALGYHSRAYSAIIKAGVRGTFHYPFIENLDTYAGIGMGLSVRTFTSSFHPDAGFFVGARYLFSEQMSFYGELGYGVANLVVGLSFNF